MVQSKWYKVTAKVSSQKGTCAANHKEGEEFIIGDSTPSGMCCWAFYSLFPFVSNMKKEAKAQKCKIRRVSGSGQRGDKRWRQRRY